MVNAAEYGERARQAINEGQSVATHAADVLSAAEMALPQTGIDSGTGQAGLDLIKLGVKLIQAGAQLVAVAQEEFGEK